eukprot:scaffold5637_cov350-Prasinococcus_capsulatus_cf.AAC.8
MTQQQQQQQQQHRLGRCRAGSRGRRSVLSSAAVALTMAAATYLRCGGRLRAAGRRARSQGTCPQPPPRQRLRDAAGLVYVRGSGPAAASYSSASAPWSCRSGAWRWC